jgi:hypothetical protein
MGQGVGLLDARDRGVVDALLVAGGGELPEDFGGAEDELADVRGRPSASRNLGSSMTSRNPPVVKSSRGETTARLRSMDFGVKTTSGREM